MAKKRFKIIYLELTNACNFTCDYCPIDQQTRAKQVMPQSFAENIIDQIADGEMTDFLTFHVMGEPYMHKNLCELTGYAEAKGLRVRLLTNGSLLEDDRNQALFDAGLTRLEIGFRTPNDKSFELRLRRRGGVELDEYIGRVKQLIALKLRSAAKTEVCIKLFIRSHGALLGLQDSYDHLTNEKDNVGIGEIFQQHVLEVARSDGASSLELEKWGQVKVRALNDEYPIWPGISLAFNRIQDFWVREQRGETGGGYPAIIGGCSAGFRDDFGILVSGEVTTCCVDYDGRNVVGDLRTHTLEEVLASDEARRIKRSFDRFRPPTEFCKECRGGPTLSSSILKQVSTVALDLRDRVQPRKAYKRLRERLN